MVPRGGYTASMERRAKIMATLGPASTGEEVLRGLIRSGVDLFRLNLSHGTQEDHRKNLVIDQGAWGAVTSHNLFDAAACWHENLLLFDGEPARALWCSAREALRRETGARGLASTLTRSLEDVAFDNFGGESGSRVRVRMVEGELDVAIED